jgi:hypothetical protein
MGGFIREGIFGGHFCKFLQVQAAPLWYHIGKDIAKGDYYGAAAVGLSGGFISVRGLPGL